MKERNVMFTETDFRILDSYKSVLDGLAAYLGDGYEIVLHSLHDLDHSVIKIINGHYTGRREGFPITDLALSMLAKIEERPDTNCITYFNRNQKGEPLKSATIVIRNHSHQLLHEHLGVSISAEYDSARRTDSGFSRGGELCRECG